MHGVTDSTFSGSSIIKVLLLVMFLISFKVSFNTEFSTSAGNLVTSTKFLGSGMKCDNSEHDSPKVGNELFNYSKATLKTLCKPLPMSFLRVPFLSIHLAHS